MRRRRTARWGLAVGVTLCASALAIAADAADAPLDRLDAPSARAGNARPAPLPPLGAAPLGARSHAAAWLGVAMEDVDGGGVRVRHVVRGSPAERAGVHEGDAIVRVDGQRVTSPGEVTRAVSTRAPGESVQVIVVRAAKELPLRVALAERPSTDEMLRMDRVGAFAPPWVGVEAIGAAPRSLAELRGRVVLVDFWATWCGACRVLAPTLSRWQARYGAQGLSVVGVSAEPAEDVALFAERTGMRYGLLSDARGETTRAYAITALPTLFVVDKRGVVRDVAIGYDPAREEQIEQLVKQLLAEPAPRD